MRPEAGEAAVLSESMVPSCFSLQLTTELLILGSGLWRRGVCSWAPQRGCNDASYLLVCSGAAAEVHPAADAGLLSKYLRCRVEGAAGVAAGLLPLSGAPAADRVGHDSRHGGGMSRSSSPHAIDSSGERRLRVLDGGCVEAVAVNAFACWPLCDGTRLVCIPLRQDGAGNIFDNAAARRPA